MQRLLLAVTVGLSIHAPAAAAVYRLVDLGIPPGAISATARAITEDGQIAGDANFGFLDTRPAKFGGAAVAFDLPAGATTSAVRQNNASGTMAATVQFGSTADTAQLFNSAGVATVLPPASGFASAGAWDINDAGVTAGFSLDSGSRGSQIADRSPIDPSSGRVQRATTWTSATPTLLPNAGGDIANSIAVAINEGGMVAGNYWKLNEIGGPTAVRWINGTIERLFSSDGYTSRRASAINETGDVAGRGFSALDGNLHAVVWTAGNSNAVALGDGPGNALSEALGLNDRGQVVGLAQADVADPSGAAIWTLSGGNWVYSDLGSSVLNLDGWQLGFAVDINNRGQIVGSGTAPDGSFRPFLLNPVAGVLSAGNSMSGGTGMGQVSAVDRSSFDSFEDVSFDLGAGACAPGGGFAINQADFTSSSPGDPKSGARVGNTDAVGVRLSARNNGSCYASVGLGRQTVNFNLGGSLLEFFGFEWSSIDPYNVLRFYSGADGTGELIDVDEFGTEITGDEVMAAFGLANDLDGRAPDAFINLRFYDVTVGSVVFDSWDNTAFEFDNIAIGARTNPLVNQLSAIAAVPAPAPIALLALGSAALLLRRRSPLPL